MLEPAGRTTWTRTRLARKADSEARISVVAVLAAIAVVTGGKVSALNTSSCLLITDVRVVITLTYSAVWEAPKAWLALVALPAIDALFATDALSALLVAAIV